jgi:hypothetical protein
MMNLITKIVPSIAMLAMASGALAGELTGNGKDLTIHGRSLCAYSGLNDTPDGLTIEVAPGVFVEIDPGGHTQSYGSFYSKYDFFESPSSPAARDAFAFPGTGCNPNHAGAGEP